MKKLSSKKQLASLMNLLIRYHVYLVSVLLLAVFVKVSFDLRRVTNPPQNDELYEDKRRELENARIKLDENIIIQIEARTIKGADVNPRNTGNSNPFE